MTAVAGFWTAALFSSAGDKAFMNECASMATETRHAAAKTASQRLESVSRDHVLRLILMSLGPVGILQYAGHCRIVRGRLVDEPRIVAVVLAKAVDDFAVDVGLADCATDLLHDAAVNSQGAARSPGVIVDDAEAA